MAVRFLLMRVGVISNEQGRPVTIKTGSILHNAHSVTYPIFYYEIAN